MNVVTRFLALFVSVFLCPLAHSQREAVHKPLKVFILAGQSNMEGQGVVEYDHAEHYNGGKGNLAHVLQDPRTAKEYAHLKNADGTWHARDDVWVWFQGKRELMKGALSVGYTGYGGKSHIGPELEFGTVMGNHFDEQVLLIKTAWGGKSLFVDFRPPSAGGVVGPYYLKMIAQIRRALSELNTHFPAYQNRGYEISGFVWQQGWNDMCTPAAIPEYARNLGHLIDDVRKELKLPNLPVVVGELGNMGPEARGNMLAFRAAQRAGAEAERFVDTVQFVETSAFARPRELSPCTGHGHHWFANAESYLRIGEALAKGLIPLLDKSKAEQSLEPGEGPSYPAQTSDSAAFNREKSKRVAAASPEIEAATADDEYVLDPDTNITILRGFDAELLYSVPESQGSWVAMAFDPKGRIIVSDQDSKGVFRVTLADEGDPASKLAVESLPNFPYLPIAWGRRTVGGALGFLYAFDSLYMSSMKGLYRIRDTDGDDTYDEFTLLKKLGVGYEHSAHSMIETEDGKGLYLVTGNHTAVPKGVPSRQPPVWGMDSLLHAMPDAMGHAVGVKAPGGWICRISPDGKDWSMVASGLRNCVDIAINREGELFTYDSDLEFDIGCPWYRPTRVNHVTSASEFGWRTGTGKWPEYFADSNGAVINIGPGSPTGISFGHHSNFPVQFQDKLFLCDWTFGTIYTVDMEESGSSYTGTKKEFLNGTPLNIAAMRFGPDGHMYFVVGGRNTKSGLYRIRCTGQVGKNQAGKNQAGKGAPKMLVAKQGLRDLRHSLEALHERRDDGREAIQKAWPYLSHDDRSIRYAARLAIENQAVDLWQARVFSASDPRTVIYASIALCRHADESLSSRVFAKLNTVSFHDLELDDRLALLRAYSLCCIRLDPPTEAECTAIITRLNPHYPAEDTATNTELCRVLSYLNAPEVVAKTIALMKVTQTKTMVYDKEMLARHEYGKGILEAMSNTPNSQNIQYAYSLRRVADGWSLEDRKYYFSWLQDTLTKSGGKSFAGHIRAIREDAIDHLAPGDASQVSWLLGDIATIDLGSLPFPKGPAVAWTTDSAMKLFSTDLRARDYDNGKLMFSAGRCVACHRFQGDGGYSGPDLGSVGKRYSIRDILVAICAPSHSVSDQYQASMVTLKDGSACYGRIIYKNDSELAIAQNPYDFADLRKIPAGKVAKIELSQVSMMPPGTIFPMNKDELANLMAYLISGGNKKHAVFKVK